jgi:hypothetical protein
MPLDHLFVQYNDAEEDIRYAASPVCHSREGGNPDMIPMSLAPRLRGGDGGGIVSTHICGALLSASSAVNR